MVPAVQPGRAWRVPAAGLLALSAATILSVAGGLGGLRLWRRLPGNQVARLEPDQLARAARAAASSAPEPVREAWLLSGLGRRFTEALRDDAALARLSAEIGSLAGRARHTQLGRLQQAAVRMRELERAGTPIERWWPALEPYLAGLGAGEFAHFEQDLLRFWAGVYRTLGVEPGTACRAARRQVGQAQGPFLEYFVARLGQVSAAARRAGRRGLADVCDTLERRLLRQWVLDPAPAGIRLLAADLLARALESNDPRTANAALARDLRAWRRTYRAAAAARPIDFLALSSAPALCPRQFQRLFAWLALTTWTGAATAAAALLTLLSAGAWLTRRQAGPRPARLALAATVAATVVGGAGLACLLLRPEVFRQDFRREWSWGPWGQPWRHALASAGMALVLPAAGALLARGRGGWAGRLARLGAVASLTWLVLAGALLGCTLGAERARGGYERAIAAAAADPFAAVAGQEAERLLAGLRAWDPRVN